MGDALFLDSASVCVANDCACVYYLNEPFFWWQLPAAEQALAAGATE